MKKTLLIAVLAVFGLGVSNAQEAGIKIGVTAALPVGELDEWYTFGVGLDVSYLWEVGDGFLLGATTGYNHYFKEELDFGFGTVTEAVDFQFIPLAASARYYISDGFFAGTDLGYALGIGDGAGSGFYYRPKVGYSLNSLGFHLSYGGVSIDGGSFSFLGVGIELGL